MQNPNYTIKFNLYIHHYIPYLIVVKKIRVIFKYNHCMGFKENLRAELKYQDMQLKELAQKTGISKNTLGNYLTGHNSLPTVENAVKISKALGVSVEYLVTGESEIFERIFPSKYRKLFDTIALFDEYDLASVNALVAKMKNRYEKI